MSNHYKIPFEGFLFEKLVSVRMKHHFRKFLKIFSGLSCCNYVTAINLIYELMLKGFINQCCPTFQRAGHDTDVLNPW